MIFKNSLFLIIIFIQFACTTGQKKIELISNEGEVEFEFLDSLRIESLVELYLADKNEQTQHLLFNERQMEELLITDLKGNIISRFEPKGEGPNKVEIPLEVAFWQEGIVIKEMSPEHKFNFFDGNFKKIAQSPALTKGLNFLTIYNSHRSFSVLENDGKTFIIGQDLNLIPDLFLDEKSENWSFYENADIGYIYYRDTEELKTINLYPKTWRPRLEEKWVGRVSSYLQVSKSDNRVAVLPSVGNELFFYELKDAGISPLFQISLIHPERKVDFPFDPKNDYVLYPFFTQLFSGGNYFLAEFHTELPQEIYDSFRAKGEEFHSDPEYWSTLENFRKVKYILIDKNGIQGAISELPISGSVHFMDSNDILYVKRSSENELDYNVYYRYRVFLK
ncbi:hypothetical protein [Cecembia calidifontis]|jgi:hypothetical protein|uniref:6-bladed beta-propeller protein n=1 Tax=Cecembia calidifontis TaxID=1187080 RepID=A0A4Q7P8L3_9BACT|nr:hypothetical protein [Cecembia calidifontis]RZS95820.1 hypothetical protein BC751_1365 [Cecembia calidifontis]